MSQPVLPSILQNSKKSIPLQVNDSTPETFWHSFTVFLSPIEEFCVQRWYILYFIFLGIKLVTTFVSNLALYPQWNDIGFFFTGGYFGATIYQTLSFTFSIANIIATGLFLTLGLANRWQRSIPRFFHTLEQRCDLTDPQLEFEKSYQIYLTEYRRALLYGKGGILIRPVVIGAVVLCGLIALTVQFVIGDIEPLLHSFSGNAVVVFMEGLWDFEADLFYPLLLMYLVTSFIWILGSTGLYIRRFVRRFPLQVQLTHPDHCDGFKFLGDFALNMALIILMAASVLAFYTIWRGYSIWTYGSSALLLFLIIASYGAFFAPVYAVHTIMLKERSAYEDAIANRALKIEEQIQEVLREGDMLSLKAVKEELEVVQALFPDTNGFPTWPFNWRILITFFSSQIVPIISLIVGLSPLASNFFANVFSFLSGH